MSQRVSWKQSLYQILISIPILFLLTFLYGIVMALLFVPQSFSSSEHGNVWPYLFSGSLLAAVLYSVLNLFYLLPSTNLILRYLAPGLIAVLIPLFTLFKGSDSATSILFLGAGLINLGVGIYHLRLLISRGEQKINKEKMTH